MINFITLKIKQLLHLPHFLLWHIYDRILYIKNKGKAEFYGWGLHVFVGAFGEGKTSTMIYKALKLCKAYPQLTILTNLKLIGFPEHTKILKLKTPKDILNAPENTLVLIDEIGTIFNSRDFAKSKESVPKILFQHLCQCRKRKMMIYGTCQRWLFLDKQLRDITATVTRCRSWMSHPFSRMISCVTYDAFDYDCACQNPAVVISALSNFVYIQTNKLRKSYDTEELITNMLNDKYISDKEILENRGAQLIDINTKVDEDKAKKSARWR